MANNIFCSSFGERFYLYLKPSTEDRVPDYRQLRKIGYRVIGDRKARNACFQYKWDKYPIEDYERRLELRKEIEQFNLDYENALKKGF